MSQTHMVHYNDHELDRDCFNLILYCTNVNIKWLLASFMWLRQLLIMTRGSLCPLSCSSCSFKILVLVVMAISIVNSDHNYFFFWPQLVWHWANTQKLSTWRPVAPVTLTTRDLSWVTRTKDVQKGRFILSRQCADMLFFLVFGSFLYIHGTHPLPPSWHLSVNLTKSLHQLAWVA